MSNRRPAPGPDGGGTSPLFVVEGVGSGPHRAGRHESAVGRAVEAAAVTDPRWAVAVSTLTALSAALDAAERKGDAYAAAQLAPRIVELCDRLGLVPTLSGAVSDDDDGPEDYGTPELVHAP